MAHLGGFAVLDPLQQPLCEVVHRVIRPHQHGLRNASGEGRADGRFQVLSIHGHSARVRGRHAWEGSSGLGLSGSAAAHVSVTPPLTGAAGETSGHLALKKSLDRAIDRTLKTIIAILVSVLPRCCPRRHHPESTAAGSGPGADAAREDS